MGKASKKKAQRREGSGQSRADFERQRAAKQSEREIAAADAARTSVAKAMLGISDMARKIQDADTGKGVSAESQLQVPAYAANARRSARRTPAVVTPPNHAAC